MAYFLAKTDPETYSIDQLEKEKRTVWDGVNNPQAVRAIRDMKSGDKVFIYHSGGLSAVVGLAKVVSDSRPDPKNPRSAVADFEYLGRVDPPVTLDLRVITLTLGFVLRLNLAMVLGIIAAIFVFRLL